jgi:hypothetical protein
MRSRKRLKNFNPVSKKSGEGHADPNRPVVNDSIQDTQFPLRLAKGLPRTLSALRRTSLFDHRPTEFGAPIG